MSHIESLAVELVEHLVEWLELRDVGNLRLSCRSLNSKVSNGRFKDNFLNKRLDLTEENLERFAKVTTVGSLGTRILHLTLVGLVYNTKGLEARVRDGTKTVAERTGPIFCSTTVQLSREELAEARTDLEQLQALHDRQERFVEAGRDVEILSAAFRNLVANGKGTLPSLTLDVSVFREPTKRLLPESGGDWKQIWTAAAHTASITWHALGASGLLLEHLYVYNNVLRCSLQCNKIYLRSVDKKGLCQSLSNLRLLSLSMTNRHFDESDLDRRITSDPDDNIDWEAGSEEVEHAVLVSKNEEEVNFSGLAELLSSCPKLDDMELHWYRTLQRRLSSKECGHHRLFAGVVTAKAVPNLSRCALRGLRIAASDLLTFIKERPITTLTLENVVLIGDGAWQSIFDYIASSDSRIEGLHLDDLWDDNLLYFDGEGEPNFPTLDGVKGPNTIHRKSRKEVEKGVTYHYALQRALGSRQAYMWRERRTMMYGPP